MNTSDERVPSVLKSNPDELVFELKVAGTTFVDGNEEFLNSLKSVPSNEINLVFSREPDNEYDSNAVRVGIKVAGYDKSRFVGYIPKSHSEVVSYVLQNRDTYNVLVTHPQLFGGIEGKENIGIFFNMKIERRVIA